MLTPDELEHLADEATPGPWLAMQDGEVVCVCSDDGDLEVVPWREGAPQMSAADARLIALAPSLAREHAALLRWATDEVRDVLLTRRELHGYDCPGDPFCHACRVLAALDEIRNKP